MSEKQILIITAVALALVLIAGGAAIWYFQFNVLTEKKQQLAALKVQVKDATDKVNKIPGLKIEIGKIGAEIALKQERIPNLDRAEYDKFANLLDNARREAGVFVPQGRWVNAAKAQAAPGRVAVPASMHKVQYEMSVKGTFYQLLRYVNLFEEQKRFINVENFTISPGTQTGGATLLTRDMKLVLFSYTYRPPVAEPLPKVDAQRVGITTPIPE